MHKVLCKYHHASPIWHCSACGAYFCPQCVPGSASNYPRSKPRCVLCDGFLEFEGGAHTAEPFWKKAADFFRYPMHKNALSALGIILLCMIILPMLPFTFLLALLLLAGMFRYGLLIVQGCIDGNLEPPSPGELFAGDEDRLLLKFIGIMVCYGVSVGYLSSVSATLAQVFGFFVPFLIPANIILLAADRQFATAINPFKVIWLIATIGAPYFLMGLLVMVITNAPYYFIFFFSHLLPGWLMAGVAGTVSAYFGYVACAMMGYTVYQYQRELGYSSTNDDEYHLEQAVFEKKKTLATIQILIQEGRYPDARKQLTTALYRDKENQELHDLLHRLLLVADDGKALAEHTCECAEFLCRKGYVGKAASYYLDTQRKIADFQLDRADVCFKVAELLFEQGKYRESLLLLRNLHKRFPEYGLIFNAYFLMAKVYAEGLHDDANALKVIEFLATQFQKNTRLAELLAYRDRLTGQKS